MTKRTIIGRNLKYFVKNRPITVHSRAEFEVFCQKPPEFVPYTISLSLLFLHGLNSVKLQKECARLYSLQRKSFCKGILRSSSWCEVLQGMIRPVLLLSFL